LILFFFFSYRVTKYCKKKGREGKTELALLAGRPFVALREGSSIGKEGAENGVYEKSPDVRTYRLCI
jgi:hypothetical protein